MDLTKLKEKIKEGPVFLKGMFSGILSSISSLLGRFRQMSFIEKLKQSPLVGRVLQSSLFDRIRNSPQFERFLSFLHDKKRQPIIFGFGGMMALFLLLMIITLKNNSGKAQRSTAPAFSADISIAPEELFFPAEPDFIPDFLPEREPRSNWSLEDIRQYWRVPGNTEYWKDEIKTAVDKLMEGVP